MESQDTLSIAATWCVRLPIPRFPIPATERSAVDGFLNHAPPADIDLAPDQKPLELLTPADLEALIGSDEIERLR
jgi:hypothetical protein